MQTAFFVGRTILGLYFLMAGMMHFMKMRFMKDYAQSKHLPMPTLSVLMTGMVLMLGGLGVMLQLAIAWSYGVLIAFLVLAAFLMHNFWKAQDPQSKMADMVNFQKNLALAAALLMLLTLQK